MEANKKKQLGKGLSALFGDHAEDYKELDKVQSIRFVSIDQLVRGKYQPRKNFSENELKELSDSIQAKGVLQPILVRRSPSQNNQYEIIAGERRWRAATLAGLKEMPVIVKDFKDPEVLEVALVENLIRQDLNPMEEAEGYERLLAEFSYTQEQLAETLHKSRSHIANTLRLLQLPKEIKQKLHEGAITAGHARALLRLKDPNKGLEAILEEDLSVREIEKIAQDEQKANQSTPLRNKRTTDSFSAIQQDIAILEENLSRTLGVAVKIQSSGSKGSITLYYESLSKLDEIITRLGKR